MNFLLRTSKGAPSGSPQSHVSNARTNLAWKETTSENRRSGGREVRGRKFWPSDPVLIRVSDAGDVEVISFVADCAWWTREYKKSLDIYSTHGSASSQSPMDSLLGTLGNFVKSRDNRDTNVDHQQERVAVSGVHDLHDWLDFDDWARWLAKTSRTGPGLLIFLCWLSVFAYYMCKCPNRRAYVKLKRDDRESM